MKQNPEQGEGSHGGGLRLDLCYWVVLESVVAFLVERLAANIWQSGGRLFVSHGDGISCYSPDPGDPPKSHSKRSPTAHPAGSSVSHSR